MKDCLNATESRRVLRRLRRATDEVAAVATLLDSSADTDFFANEAKRLEMELNIFESRLRKAPTFRIRSESARQA